ncbi:MAG: alkaline phosphatase [Candidatus Hydrogenedentota bacterium]
MFRQICVHALAMALAGTTTFAQEPASSSKAKNVIFLIADGWGFNHIEATNYFQFGELGHQPYETGFEKLGMSTFSINGGYDVDQAWSSYEYFKLKAADSAATATTMSSGVKTLDGRIGVDAEGKPVRGIVEHAHDLGKATGVITTVQMSHATPAAFASHNDARKNYEQIGHEMIQESKINVLMGAGHPYFDNDGKLIATQEADGSWTTKGKYDVVGGIATWQQVVEGKAGADIDGDGEADPWMLIDSREEFQKMATGDTPKRVLGIAPVPETLQASRTGVDDKREDDLPYQTPLLETSPTAAEMIAAALNVLDNNDKGFVLVAESGGAVDWASHANAMGRMIEEMAAFGDAVQAVTQWVESNSNWDETLVIVTGDHECGYLWGEGSDPDWIPIQNKGKGNLPGFKWGKTSHSNHLIPCFVRGAGSDAVVALADQTDKRVGKFLDNAELGKVLFEVLK